MVQEKERRPSLCIWPSTTLICKCSLLGWIFGVIVGSLSVKKIKTNENNHCEKHEKCLLTTLASQQDVRLLTQLGVPLSFITAPSLDFLGKADWIRGAIKEIISSQGAQRLLLHSASQQPLSEQRIQNRCNETICVLWIISSNILSPYNMASEKKWLYTFLLKWWLFFKCKLQLSRISYHYTLPA